MMHLQKKMKKLLNFWGLMTKSKMKNQGFLRWTIASMIQLMLITLKKPRQWDLIHILFKSVSRSLRRIYKSTKLEIFLWLSWELLTLISIITASTLFLSLAGFHKKFITRDTLWHRSLIWKEQTSVILMWTSMKLGVWWEKKKKIILCTWNQLLACLMKFRHKKGEDNQHHDFSIPHIYAKFNIIDH